MFRRRPSRYNRVEWVAKIGRSVIDLTLAIPDELATHLRSVEERLLKILELRLREWLSTPADYAGVSDLLEEGWAVCYDPRGVPPMRYTVVLEKEADGGYVASVPALPGCVSQGDGRAEALANIREAIELYVEDCRDAGDPVPTEAGKEFVEVEAT